MQRKVTYRNLGTWYAELREFRPEIPCVLVANKIDGGALPDSGVRGPRGPKTHPWSHTVTSLPVKTPLSGKGPHDPACQPVSSA